MGCKSLCHIKLLTLGGNSTTLSIYMGGQAVSNDWILASTTGFDVWEYPVYRGGQRFVNGDVIIVDPTGPVKKWLNSKETDSWIEDHEAENILSYPKYDPLDPSDNLAQDNPMVADSSVIQGVTKLMSPPSGDGSYWALMSSEFGESTIEESNNFGVEIGASLELSGGLEFFGVKIISSFKARVEGTYDQSEVNTYTTTFSSGDSLHVQYGGIDTDGTYAENRKYEITPHAYWGRNGALVLDYGSNPAANQSPLYNTWWQDHYSDAVFVINYVFKGGAAPDPLCLGDANGDSQTNVGDAVYLIGYVFRGGPAPVEPCCLPVIN